MNYKITIYYAELALKGKNRQQFVKKLRQNINKKLKSLGYNWPVKSIHDRIFVEVDPQATAEQSHYAVQQLATIPGIAWLSLVHWFAEKQYHFLKPKQPNLQAIEQLIIKLAQQTHQKNHSFAVRVKRSDKKFALSSQQLERQLGAVITQNSDWKTVNLKQADQYFYLNISSQGIAVHLNKIKATGGLPVSATGRVLTLLSGGFDSPVAAWLMANRGCNVDFIHFSASHHNTTDIENYKIAQIVKTLSQTTGRCQLFIVPYTHFDLALLAQDLKYDLILFRRFMARVAEQLMTQIGASALVTGDNLAQVASQTLENINAMNQAVTASILRPLLTYNKEQIINQSTALNLFDLSRQPYKDCCALISKTPKTKSDHQTLQQIEQQHLPNYQQLIDDTLAETTRLTYNFGKLVHQQ